MVDRVRPIDAGQVAVDAYIERHLLGTDTTLDAVLGANSAAGLPAIDVAPVQGKLLHLLARMSGAARILELGTLGGYSTIWLARALPEGGSLVTLESDPRHADVARANIARAGLSDRVEVRTGAALDAMAALKAQDAVFDFIFVDADKPNNVPYLDAALGLSRSGTVIVYDNVVREGEILDADSPDPRVQGTRALFEAVAREPRLRATAIQTVGIKKWDGMLVAIVD